MKMNENAVTILSPTWEKQAAAHLREVYCCPRGKDNTYLNKEKVLC